MIEGWTKRTVLAVMVGGFLAGGFGVSSDASGRSHDLSYGLWGVINDCQPHGPVICEFDPITLQHQDVRVTLLQYGLEEMAQ